QRSLSGRLFFSSMDPFLSLMAVAAAEHCTEGLSRCQPSGWFEFAAQTLPPALLPGWLTALAPACTIPVAPPPPVSVVVTAPRCAIARGAHAVVAGCCSAGSDAQCQPHHRQAIA